jgi:hypothetical protein
LLQSDFSHPRHKSSPHAPLMGKNKTLLPTAEADRWREVARYGVMVSSGRMII